MSEQSDALTEFGEAIQRRVDLVLEVANKIGQAFADVGLQLQRDMAKLGKAVWRSPDARKAMRQHDPSAQGMYATYAAYRKNQAARRHRRGLSI